MKNRKIIITIIIILIFITVIIGFGLKNSAQRLVSSEQSNPTPTPISQSPQAPKTFKFDRNTDLKSELEKVNPQVLDADFN